MQRAGFTSEAWATSSAAHAVDLATGKDRFSVIEPEGKLVKKLGDAEPSPAKPRKPF